MMVILINRQDPIPPILDIINCLVLSFKLSTSCLMNLRADPISKISFHKRAMFWLPSIMILMYSLRDARPPPLSQAYPAKPGLLPQVIHLFNLSNISSSRNPTIRYREINESIFNFNDLNYANFQFRLADHGIIARQNKQSIWTNTSIKRIQ